MVQISELERIQVELERRGRHLGAFRYDNRTDVALKGNRANDTSFGVVLIGKYVGEFTDVLNEVSTKRKGYRVPAVLGLIEEVELPIVAMVTLSSIMGFLTTSISSTRMANHIADNLFHEVQKAKLGKAAKNHYGHLAKNDRAAGKEAVNALEYVASLSGDLIQPWSEKDKTTLGRLLIELVRQKLHWIDIQQGELKTKSKTRQNAPEIVVAKPEINEWITQHREEVRLLSPVYLPMVVPPRDWSLETMYNGCYLTDEQAPVSFIKRKNRVQMARLKQENPVDVFKAVNAIQSTAWRIRRPVLNLLKRIQDEKLELNLPISSMPPQQDILIPDEAPYHVRKAYLNQNRELANLRAVVGVNIANAEEFAEFERFYIPHHLDTRGRAYPIPALNPQGADYIKGLLEFADGKRVGDAGIFWLKVHAANLFGVDKVSFEQRVQWVDEHWRSLLESALFPLECLFWTQAEKPIQAFAVCLELLGVAMEGADYVSRMPVALDGSCSGLQHLGAAFRCDVTGKAVNLVDSECPNDIYQDVADKVQELLTKELSSDNKALASQWLAFCGGKIERKITKRPVMTYPYGSKVPGFTQQLLDDVIKPAMQNDPDSVPFDNLRLSAQYLAKLIEQAVSATVLKASEAMEWMQKMAAAIAAGNKTIHWTTPLGFPVVQDYRKLRSRQINSVVFGTRLQCRVAEVEDAIDTRKMVNAISPNVVHSLDATHLLLTVLKAEREGINQFALVHDSFATYAADTERFFVIIREAFAELYKNDVFAALEAEFKAQAVTNLKSKTQHTLPKLPAKGHYQLESIIHSSFAFA
ncbi:hypothetical protein KIH87_03335 [Paraneptunicella aestuarii]|uniref:DNA-directed RNA polymerase n=1 Tax=Paraneptunicella aestuarii TaxID=2831148 RepID=UPI001E56B0EF|nr:DNA-directed RNA polymerase [Paraneptunicella aestuarii]UAA39404.1 hypothetical protein KIH87_03335 [Paraneptunicella aestuarii]